MKLKVVFCVLGAVLTAPFAAAHHNFAAHYRTDETVEITGVVTEFRFVNPHVQIYFDITNASGAL